nr:MAG TPA: hypothetical protein [Caudoviricetes sp.]
MNMDVLFVLMIQKKHGLNWINYPKNDENVQGNLQIHSFFCYYKTHNPLLVCLFNV